MIPQRLELSDIQAAFRDFETRFGRLLTGDIELNQRRVVGAGPSIAPFDYVTRFELDNAVSELETAVGSLGASTGSPTSLDLGFVKAIAVLTSNALALGAGTNKVTVLGSLGTTTTLLHGNAGGAPTFGAVVLTSDVSGTLPTGNGGTGITYDRLTATLSFQTQTVTLGPTAIASAGSQYRFNYSLFITTTDVGLATVQVSVNYTDDVGATSQTGTAIAVTATNRDRGSFVIYRFSGNITYTVTVTGAIGTAVYAFYATLERLS